MRSEASKKYLAERERILGQREGVNDSQLAYLAALKQQVPAEDREELELFLRSGIAVCQDCGRQFKAGCRYDVCIDCLSEQGGAN